MNDHVIEQLKQIYELEKFQAYYYTSQLSATEDGKLNRALKKFVETQKEHMDYFNHVFQKHHIDLSTIRGTITNITASIVGESVEITGPANICKIGAALEKKALSHYYSLTNDRNLDKDLLEQLIDFQLEKEFHGLWLQYYSGFIKHDKSNKEIMFGSYFNEHPTINMNVHLT